MPSFQAMFFESKGKPIQYQGKTLVMMDRFPMEQATSLRLVFEGHHGRWRQGVSLVCDGQFRIKGRIFEGRNQGIGLWQDTAPTTVEIELVGSIQHVQIHNVWDTGDGSIHYWHNGAAMLVEELPNGRRYRCNDGEPDEDFDNLIIRLERVL